MNYYDEIAKGYNELHGEEQLEKLKEVKGIIKFSKRDTVVDIGCGTGILTKKISKDVKFIIGIDDSRGMLRQTKKEKNIFYILGKSGLLPFKSNSFSKAVSFSAIQNMNPKKMIKEAKRVSKEIIITVPKKIWDIKKIKSLGNFKIKQGKVDFIFYW